MRIALGTAQFGLDYGIANTGGKISSDEAASILKTALDVGITTLDTAVGYGDSEKVLGKVGVERWQIITKLPMYPSHDRNVKSWIRNELYLAMERLKVDRIFGLLLHRPDQLLGPHGRDIYQSLIEIKEDGLVEKIGISIYEPDLLDLLIPKMKIDLVQAPLNVLDRRLISSGWLRKLYDSGTEVHARSVFLQGLLLMPPEDRPMQFQHWTTTWNKWDNWLKFNQVSALSGSLAFPLSFKEISKLVVGVDSEQHLKQIVDAIGENSALHFPEDIVSVDQNLINPSLWRLE